MQQNNLSQLVSPETFLEITKLLALAAKHTQLHYRNNDNEEYICFSGITYGEFWVKSQPHQLAFYKVEEYKTDGYTFSRTDNYISAIGNAFQIYRGFEHDVGIRTSLSHSFQSPEEFFEYVKSNTLKKIEGIVAIRALNLEEEKELAEDYKVVRDFDIKKVAVEIVESVNTLIPEIFEVDKYEQRQMLAKKNKVITNLQDRASLNPGEAKKIHQQKTTFQALIGRTEAQRSAPKATGELTPA